MYRSASFDAARAVHPQRLCLKRFWQAGLFQDAIGGVARLNVVVDGKSDARDRTFPNLVIATAVSYEIASGFLQNFLQFWSETFHAAQWDRVMSLFDATAV
jgi:hypothetical protein